MKILASLCLALALAFGAAACGDDDADCKSACDKLSTCGLKSSGLSCDTNCAQGDCAGCVVDTSCADIEADKCSERCPGVAFTKK